jgi:hypothetical protein
MNHGADNLAKTDRISQIPFQSPRTLSQCKCESHSLEADFAIALTCSPLQYVRLRFHERRKLHRVKNLDAEVHL